MASVPISLEEPSRPGAPGGFALWQLGFRPFYAAASLFAALSIAQWALQFLGVWTQPLLRGPLWHAHEMLFGFAVAVIVGFLFTAGRNWSNQPTPTGATLAALTTLWLAGRVLVLTPYTVAAAIVDPAFTLAAAIALAIPFIRARNRRNYFFVALLVGLSLANLSFHLAELGVIGCPASVGITIGLDVVLFVMAVMGGRVIPMFTNSGVPGAAATRQPGVERAALGATLALLAADALGLGGAVLALVAAFAAVAHAARWILWQPWTTRRAPLVWVLHAAYAFIPLHLALRAFAACGWVAPSIATHALTVGAIGGLVIGMVTRTARGHTGRPLRAGRAEVVCYALVLLAAVVRVGVPLAAPALTLPAIGLAAALWCAGFALYAVTYWPVLSRPRLDGRPG
jgi:uncharacterized protein involved in response to NO